MADTKSPASGNAHPIKRALDKSKNVQKAVEEAADELAVVHVVLDKEIAPDARTDEVDRAIEKTEQIEKKLAKSADVLEKVAETLDEVAKKTS